MFSDLRFMLGFEVDVFTKLCWVVITPLALISIFIYSLVVFQLPTYDDSAYPQIAYGASLGYWRQLTSVTPSPMSRPVPVTATPLSQIRPRHGRGPIESQPCDNCTLASISTHACTGPNLSFLLCTHYCLHTACGWILTGVAVGVVPICFVHALYHTSGNTFVQVSLQICILKTVAAILV